MGINTAKAVSLLKFLDFNLPSTLVSKFVKLENKVLIGVSTGIAEGELVSLDGLGRRGKKILYTKILSPDLVSCFDKIEGIVSESGSLLSHLAIMARENSIPVVVNVDLKREDIVLGETVVINGSEGSVEKKY